MSVERSFHSIDGRISCSLEPCWEDILPDSTGHLLTYRPWRRHGLWHNQLFCLWLCWSWEHRSGAQQWGRWAQPGGPVCLSSTTLSTPGNKTAAQSHHKNVPMASVTAPSTSLDLCWASGKGLQPPVTPCLHSVTCLVLMRDRVSSMEKVSLTPR